MADQVCDTCGTSNPASASFCRVCDTFLGWHDDMDEPTPGPAATDPAEAGSGSEQSTTTQADGTPTPPQDRVRPPAVSPDTAEVVVTAVAPGSFELSIKNDSTIVDSYVIQPSAPPSWLTVVHSDTNLLPNQVRTVQVTLAVRPLELALAQRTTIPLQVRSSVDPGQFTEVAVTVVVPKDGPPATLVAHPSLIRLEDRGQGTFSLRFDNGAANFPRQYRLSASDPEGVVVFEFAPPTVDVAAGETADAVVRFAAPEPAPGEDITRQLTITGVDDDGPVSVQVTVSQSTMPEPERQPVRMRVEPSKVAIVDSSTATVDLLIDNRAGTELVKVNLSGRDEARAVSFDFEFRRVAIPAGKQGWVRVQARDRPAAARPVVDEAVHDRGGRRSQRGGGRGDDRGHLPAGRDRNGAGEAGPRAPGRDVAPRDVRGGRGQPLRRRAPAGAPVRCGRVRAGASALLARRPHGAARPTGPCHPRGRAPAPTGRQLRVAAGTGVRDVRQRHHPGRGGHDAAGGSRTSGSGRSSRRCSAWC